MAPRVARSSPVRGVGHHNANRTQMRGLARVGSSSGLRVSLNRCCAGSAATPSAVGLAAVFTFAIFGIIIAALAPCALGGNPEGRPLLGQTTADAQQNTADKDIRPSAGVGIYIEVSDGHANAVDEYTNTDSTHDADQHARNLANHLHTHEQHDEQPERLLGNELVGLSIGYTSLSIVVLFGFGIWLAHMFWCRRRSSGKLVLCYGVAIPAMYPSYPPYTLRDIDLSEVSTPISRDPATKLAAELLITIV